jgi:hypothetical protein
VRRQIQAETVYNEIIELSMDLLKRGKTPSNKCYAIITDSTYTTHLTPQIFAALVDKPVFVVTNANL